MTADDFISWAMQQPGGARGIIHHERDAAGLIMSRLVHDQPVRLDPPGIVIDRLFG